MLGALVWNLDPVLLDLGPLQIRYYGVLFALTIYTGYYVWHQQAVRHGETERFAESFLWWGVVAVVAGARLGHCLFYEPETYLKNPITILYFWKGGLASHGATLGLVVAVFFFARKWHRTWFRVADYLAPAIAIAAGGVRLGNFFNSEIVGRPTDVPWAVVFARYDALPRHPSQIYEFLMGVATFLALMALQRRDIRRAGSGFMAGSFFAIYFSFRFIVEFFKEFQTEQLREGSGPLAWFENTIGYHFTMGQWLSVIPVAAGLWLVARALRMPKEAIPEVIAAPEPRREEPAAARRKAKKR